MTVKELYLKLCEYIPESLRLPWDNDGMMLCPDSEEEVNNGLIALDVTEEIVDYAIKRGFGLIISHHPLIFKPIASLTEDNHISRKVIKLISNNISVFSFHTRLDIVYGGVNDRLASILGIENVKAFGEDNLGRIGTISEECELEVFAEKVKSLFLFQGILPARHRRCLSATASEHGNREERFPLPARTGENGSSPSGGTAHEPPHSPAQPQGPASAGS